MLSYEGVHRGRLLHRDDPPLVKRERLVSNGPAPLSSDDDFFIWVNGPRGNALERAGAVIKDGPQVVKTVEYGLFGNPENPKRNLQFHRFEKTVGEDAESSTSRRKSAWSCENEEVDRLLAFLQRQVARPGRYQIVDRNSPAAELLGWLESGDVDTQGVVEALANSTNAKQIIAQLAAQNDQTLSAAQSAVLQRRRALIHRLRELIDDTKTTETDVQKLIGNSHWIFGGRYVGVAERRNLTMLDQHDIPLLGSDGTLHVVELKGPGIEKLIVRYRNHWIVGAAVHEATAQAANYLRDLDEQGLVTSGVFANELGQRYDMSRCFATVVIGHSGHYRPSNVEREVIGRTLRQYSATLNRIEVITYDQLVESADRALNFETDINEAASNADDHPS